MTWTRETVLEFAARCENRRQFHWSGVDVAARRLGCYDEALALVPCLQRPPWTREELLRTLPLYASKTHARREDKPMYDAARRLGVWDSYWSARNAD